MRRWIIRGIFVTLVFMTTLTITSWGQGQKISIGYEQGLSLVSGRGNRILNSSQKPKLSFSSAAFLQYKISKDFSLRTILSFERKGFSFGTRQLILDSVSYPVMVNAHNRFDYICLALLPRIGFGNKNRFFVNAGPYAGYLIGQALVNKMKDGPKRTDHNIDQFSRWDFGTSIGAGIEIPIKTLTLSIEIRDNLGLSNISKLPVIDEGAIRLNSLNLIIAVHKK